jgi:hypothetical protein
MNWANSHHVVQRRRNFGPQIRPKLPLRIFTVLYPKVSIHETRRSLRTSFKMAAPTALPSFSSSGTFHRLASDEEQDAKATMENFHAESWKDWPNEAGVSDKSCLRITRTAPLTSFDQSSSRDSRNTVDR